jgi:TrmH family RNA methyltransferase
MLSKNQIKYINSLQLKKFRQQYQSFVVEGTKSILELISSDYKTEILVATDEFLQKYGSILPDGDFEILNSTANDLSKLGSFQTNDGAIAVVKMKPNNPFEIKPADYTLVLDDIRDPGNLGTIIRIADWYGFNGIICSETTTDFYNPKVIAASKGSFCRIHIIEFLMTQTEGRQVIGMLLEGKSLYEYKFPRQGAFVVMGNESHGISDDIREIITDPVSIPRFGQAESLNVGIATAVICDHIRQKTGK